MALILGCMLNMKLAKVPNVKCIDCSPLLSCIFKLLYVVSPYHSFFEYRRYIYSACSKARYYCARHSVFIYIQANLH